ncbi:MAG: SAM-dependent methyltransferase [Ruminococcaceae bacterium]|nr:SAM-dependent methyltransferase [Oscillospiraceae bacterium]
MRKIGQSQTARFIFNCMTEKNIPILDSRLSLAASFVRDGAVVADVGTDHAYIPIYLLKTGKASAAIAADINEGPLERARINCSRYGVFEGITFCLADGLSTLPLSELCVSDIVICGMGGELIASIIDASDYVKNPAVRLILQPMSQVSRLREYLAGAGFSTVCGGMTKAQDKLYQCIVCRYDGTPRTLSPAALELGEENINAERTPIFIETLEALIKKTERAIDGRRLGGLDTASLEGLLSELYEIKGKSNDCN